MGRENKLDYIVAALSALAQETRLRVFRELVKAHDTAPGKGGLAAGELSDALGVAASTLSFHLKEMQWSDLVTARKKGRSVIYKANLTAMQNLVAYLLDDCCRGACNMTLRQKEKIL